MKIYYTGGTLGDSYIILCKLYSIAKKESIICKHFTRHKNVRPAIKEIFGLLPNITIKFLDEIPSIPFMRGVFKYPGYKDEKRIFSFNPTYYPIFSLPDISKFKLPKNYTVIQPISGTHRRRKLSNKLLNKIIDESNLMPVIIEKDKYKFDKHAVFNLSERTSLKEAMAIIRGSKHFYGPSGIFSYFAVSQKVLSSVYLHGNEEKSDHYIRIEAVKEWELYVLKRTT